MNDDFLYRLRVDPSPEFGARLKAQLDAQSGRVRRGVRWGVPLLIFGTAFALTLPDFRHALVRLVSETPAPSTVEQTNPSEGNRAKHSPTVALPGPRGVPSPAEAQAPRPAGAAPTREIPPVSTLDPAHSNVIMRRVSALAVVIANAPPLPGSRADGSAVPHSSTLEDEAYEAILLRRSALKVMGWTAEPMVEMVLRKRKFDLDLLQVNAARLAELTPLMKESFQQDTRGFGFETRALDSIWTQRDDFKFRADQLTRAANALANAPGRAAPIATLDALRRVLEACAECHEAYLRKDSDDGRR